MNTAGICKHKLIDPIRHKEQLKPVGYYSLELNAWNQKKTKSNGISPEEMFYREIGEGVGFSFWDQNSGLGSSSESAFT